MNDTLNPSFEANFSSKYRYEELINLLLSGNIKEKHFAVLELEEIHSQEDAKVLVSNLVRQDGKIREAVAFKINELINKSEFSVFFLSEDVFEILFQGILDINGNVCRNIVNLVGNNEFGDYVCKILPEIINKTLEKIEELESNEKQYKISKRNFQLYWCLEALYNIIENIEFEKIKNIIFKTAKFQDYTIREKTAKILTKLNNPEVKELKETLKNDGNYYVKRYLTKE